VRLSQISVSEGLILYRASTLAISNDRRRQFLRDSPWCSPAVVETCVQGARKQMVRWSTSRDVRTILLVW
jgi:hypothetical protein